MRIRPQNHTLQIGDMVMDYVTFGKGEKPLILIPGLNLKSVKEVASPMAHMYHIVAEDYKVYLLDRREDIPEGYTVRDIAADVACAMKELGIENADVLGISQGGMIGQYLAIDYPHLVHKLVLGVTLSRENPVIKEVITRWIAMAEQGDYQGISTDMLENMYTEEYKEKYGKLIPLLSKAGKPRDMQRFIRLARACFSCETYEILEKIKCPVFVIGGRKDNIVSGEASEEIAERLGCEIYMYEDMGHAVHEEAKDFNHRVLEFLRKE